MDQKADSVVSKTNPAEIFEAPKLSVDRLPQLRALFERLSTGCVESFKDLFTTPIGCFLNQVESGDSWDLLDSREDCVAALFYVSEWDSQILILIERRLLFAAMDAMYGSDGSEAQVDTSHVLTPLDLRIAREISQLTATSLMKAFQPLTAITVAFEKIETEIEFNILGPQNVPSVFAQLLFQIYDSGGRLFVLVPRTPLMPMRKKLERGTLKEAQVDDPRWTAQLQTRVSSTQVAVRAIADGPVITLGDVCNLKVGQVLPVEAIERAGIVLTSGDTPMFKCGLGQLDGRLSIKIDTTIDPPKMGLTDNVLAEAMRGWPPNATHKS